MGLKASLVVLLFASIALTNAASFQFTGNFSGSLVKDQGWNFQATSLSVFNLPLWLGGNFKSANSEGSLQNGNADIVTGSAYVNVVGFPFNFLAYFKASYNLGNDSDQELAEADFDASAGYIGNVFLSLEEVNTSGSIVDTHPLQWRVIGNTGFRYRAGDSNTDLANGPLYTQFIGTSNENNNLVITLTFLSSDRAGIVNENIELVPKSIESVIRIQNYPYANSANHIQLVLGVGTGGAKVSASGRTVTSDDDTVYFSLSKSATVGGNVDDVSISTFVNGDLSTASNANFNSQLSGKYGAQADFQIVKVAFPAGASDITYDPTIGNGKPASEASSSSTVAPIVSFVVLFILALAL